MSRYLEYIGGLGDIYLLMHVNSCYEQLSTLETTAKIVIASVNPFAAELFVHHPKRQQLEIVSLPHWWPEEDAAMRERYGLPPLVDFKKWPKREDPYKPIAVYPYGVPFPLPQDYIVVQLAAGEKFKSFPVGIAMDVVSRIAERIPVVLIGRSYPGQRPGYDRSEQRIFAENVLSLVDRLSVPETIHVIRSAKAVVTPCSFAQIVGWLSKKPLFVLYNESLRDWDITPMLEGRKSFDGCGLLHPKTVHGLFSDYNSNTLDYWLNAVL